ncbi:MAG: hypothetical protein RIM99_11305 [Cyclobacteriaceae bacterium]
MIKKEFSPKLFTMKKYVLFISAFVLFLISCQNETNIAIDESVELTRPAEPDIDFEFNTPDYPIEVVYIIQKEFENQVLSSGLTKEGLSKIAYLEKRILELYPEKGYKGMLIEDQKLFDRYLEEYALYEEELRIHEEKMGIESIVENSVPFSLANLKLTKSESQRFNELDAIASKMINSEDIHVLMSSGASSRGPIALSIAGAGLSVNIALVILAEDRARSLAVNYFGNENPGTKGDAFKHIYVSMHLRRYQSKAIAKLIMDTWEALNSNQPRDRQMDFHNNVIGRDTRYSLFRGSMLGDLNDWQQWGRNVRDYINYCTNGMPMDQFYDWDDNPPSTRQAIFNISAQPYNNIRYVYYEETCPVSPCWAVYCATGYMCVNGQCVPDPNYGGCPNVPCPRGSLCVGGTCVEL